MALPRMMKEAHVHADTSVTIHDVPLPKIEDPQQILIQVVVSGCNPKDWKMPAGFLTTITDCPNSGDDIAGFVAAVGESVIGFKPGDRVAALHQLGAPGGSYAEYALVWEFTTFHIGHNTSFEAAATVPMISLMAAMGIYGMLRMSTGPWQTLQRTPLLVYGGASGVGSMAVKLASLLNARLICIAGRGTPFVEGLINKESGDTVIDYRGKSSDEVVESIKAALHGEKLEFAFDAVSEKDSFRNIAQVLDDSGRVTFVLPWVDAEFASTVMKSITMAGSLWKKLTPLKGGDLGTLGLNFSGRDFGFVWSKLIGRMLEDGRLLPHPYEVADGGLLGVENALKKLKAGKVSALKLVCDETKPYCQRCTTHGLECGGYTVSPPKRTPTFRDQTDRVAARAQAEYARSRSQPGSQLSRPRVTMRPHAFPAQLLDWPVMSALPSPFDMNTTRETRTQLLNQFMRLYLPDEGPVVISHFAYLYALPDLVGQHPAIPSAIDALCSVQLGTTYQDPEVLLRSKSLYGVALSRLSRALTRPKLYSPISTLAAILLIALCELYQGASEDTNAWASHMHGALLVLESYGPSSMDTNLGRLLIHSLRYTSICVGLVQRKAVVFDQPAWTALTSKHPAPDNWTELMDLIVHLPCLLAETDLLCASFSHGKATDLLFEVCTMQDRLRFWFQQLQTELPEGSGQLTPIQHFRGWEEDAGDVFSEVYKFVECRDSYLTMSYWLSMLVLGRDLLKLQAFPGLVDIQFPMMCPEEREEQVFGYAINLCRCIPACSQSITPFVSRFNVAVACGLVASYFLDMGHLEEYAWCLEVSERVHNMGFNAPDSLKAQLIDPSVTVDSYQ